jgi:hypothetical protein
MAGSKKHIHKYFKVILGYVKVWRCAIADCNHYMPKHLENMVEGRASICWECDEVMKLNPLNMETDRPVCEFCRTGTNREEVLLSGKSSIEKFIKTRNPLLRLE